MEELREIAVRQFDELGIEYDLSVASVQLRKAMVAAGIRPEENLLSRGILEAREE